MHIILTLTNEIFNYVFKILRINKDYDKNRIITGNRLGQYDF